jgi:TonB family protein
MERMQISRSRGTRNQQTWRDPWIGRALVIGLLAVASPAPARATPAGNSSILKALSLRPDLPIVTPPPPPPPPPPPIDPTKPQALLTGSSMVPPRYPHDEACDGIGGTVILLVAVDSTGAVLNVTVEKSSRNRNLDRAAIDAARSWHFSPGQLNGQSVGGLVRVPVQFTPSNPGHCGNGVYFNSVQYGRDGKDGILISADNGVVTLSQDDWLHLRIDYGTESKQAADVPLAVVWTYQESGGGEILGQDSAPIVAPGSHVADFDLKQAGKWRPGIYIIQVLVGDDIRESFWFHLQLEK